MNNKIKYIIFNPEPSEISLVFESPADVEDFLAAQSNSINWQGQWKVERISAYGKFHWVARTDRRVALNS